MSVYAPGIPALTGMAVAPWLPGGSEVGLPIAFASVVSWLTIVVPLVLGFKSRVYWGVVIYFYVGIYCAVALPIAILALGALIMMKAGHRPPEFYDVWFGLGLIAMLPFWPQLIRILCLKYWQPWTKPDQWEVDVERVGGWVYDAAGVRRPLDKSAERAAKLRSDEPTTRRKP